MKYIYSALNWIFGVFFLLAGLASLIDSYLAAISLILISALLLPPIRKFCHSKLDTTLSTKPRAISIFVLFIIYGVFMGQAENEKTREIAEQQAQEAAELALKVREENINYFNDNRTQIISTIKDAISSKEYQSAIAQASKYLVSGDYELDQLNSQATSILIEIEAARKAAREKAANEAKTLELVTTLKTVSESEYKENLNIYNQLASMNPENANYKEKVEYYSIKVQEQLEAEKEERERIEIENQVRLTLFGEQPIQSAWDGSYYAVERYLKIIANDPDSIEIDACTKVYKHDEGWVVGCDYRGRNAFGGMIRQSNWFTIAHDTVVEMHDSSAFNP